MKIEFMKLESISQEPAIAANKTITIATFKEVESSCILARQAIDALGRPGKDSDLEMMGGEGNWTIMWSKPQLTLEEATQLLQQAIA